MARQAEQDPTNLYIANLPHSVKESDLETMFSPYGQVGVVVVVVVVIFVVVDLETMFSHYGQVDHPHHHLHQHYRFDLNPARRDPAVSSL